MMKRIFIIILIMIIMISFCGISFAADAGGGEGGGGSAGSVAFKDALLGAALGAVLGLTIYMIDSTNIQSKLGVGILIGIIGGAYYGISETKGAIEIDNDNIKLAQPSLIIQKFSNNDIVYGATILKVSL
ncbi:MAG: hypothetical protein HQK91_08995 [Nitrospirae bacterium]|nr:hypothetical protein [Nitrospirota bacterium]